MVTAWIALAFIAYATLCPLQERPELDSFDLFSHFDHFAGYAALGAIFALAYPRKAFLVCLIVFGSAVFLELAQTLTPDRHARISDALRKLIGGAFGIAFGRLVFKLWLQDYLMDGDQNPSA